MIVDTQSDFDIFRKRRDHELFIVKNPREKYWSNILSNSIDESSSNLNSSNNQGSTNQATEDNIENESDWITDDSFDDMSKTDEDYFGTYNAFSPKSITPFPSTERFTHNIAPLVPPPPPPQKMFRSKKKLTNVKKSMRSHSVRPFYQTKKAENVDGTDVGASETQELKVANSDFGSTKTLIEKKVKEIIDMCNSILKME